MYLYVLKSDALERVPEPLLAAFGKPHHAFDLVLTPERKLLREAAPDLEVLTSGDSAELASQAADCPVWLGQPDLLATLLRQGHQPQWLQSTWAGITPLLADGLPRHYRLTRAVGIFGQVM